MHSLRHNRNHDRVAPVGTPQTFVLGRHIVPEAVWWLEWKLALRSLWMRSVRCQAQRRRRSNPRQRSSTTKLGRLPIVARRHRSERLALCWWGRPVSPPALLSIRESICGGSSSCSSPGEFKHPCLAWVADFIVHTSLQCTLVCSHQILLSFCNPGSYLTFRKFTMGYEMVDQPTILRTLCHLDVIDRD